MKIKRILLFVIPCIIIIIVGIILGGKEKDPSQETTGVHKVTFYLTQKDYCNCVDCGCQTGPKVYKEVEVKDGDKVVKPENPTEEIREFLGWATTDGGAELFDFNTPIKEDLKLYSVWKEKVPTPSKTTYKVTFYKTLDYYCNCLDCGCPTGPEIYKTVEVEEGEKVTKPEDPTQDKKIFVGWTTTLDKNDVFDFNTPITKDTALYSQWKQK